ncbi:hypothetical protein CHGG_08512 [Chaetomium globosum CBS 148.51]|uniref:6-phosphogluconate dehydrogenase NADP-binding domain-containing protein n=1 Tax=Chaetomium globosum (strain ATCC 6205 / CBS 148.51 / DSM 1962 / NBRC 6347 / NRRL 1970) TaxID=306901 RepID=Q2GU42_CHAGB|nr:uncharacterized protein CHGG_08512 [Chaetomium globosum CBS 148.51]EAQ84498.1 hypothetical protein CHGG_08512 [Chaetomium globosum CBS 148.51]
MATITSIGIGNMGAALASALLKSANPPQLTIWNRTADRPQVKALITSGATFEPSLTAAIARSTTILICLLDYAAITTALAPLSATTSTTDNNDTPGPLTGKTIINLTNGTPTQARAMAATLTGLGAAAYFDGGIMVTPQLVGTPASFVILSSGGGGHGTSQAEFEDGGVAALLQPVGKVEYVAGDDAGAASLYDVAALTAMYGMFMGAFTGIALLGKQKGQDDGGEKGVVQEGGGMGRRACGISCRRVRRRAWMGRGCGLSRSSWIARWRRGLEPVVSRLSRSICLSEDGVILGSRDGAGVHI